MRAVVEPGDVVAIWDEELAEVPAWSLVLRGRGVEVDVRGELAYSGASTIKTFLLEQASLAVAADSLSWDVPVAVTPSTWPSATVCSRPGRSPSRCRCTPWPS